MGLRFRLVHFIRRPGPGNAGGGVGRSRHPARALSAAAAVGSIVGALALSQAPVAVASSNVLVFLSNSQTVAPASNSGSSPAPTSGSVIIETQNGSGVPVVQGSPLTVTLTAGSYSGGAEVTSIPTSITIPSGQSSAAFTFTPDSTSTTSVGYFVIVASASGYTTASQTETVDPSGGDTTTVIDPGNPDGDASLTPVGVGTTVSYFAGASSASYVQAGATTADYQVTDVGGVVPNGGGQVSGLQYCVEITAGTKASLPHAVLFNTSTYRPGGTYVISFVVSEYAAGSKCTGPISGYYGGNAQLEITRAAGYTPLTPTRLWDTRGHRDPLQPRGTLNLTVTGNVATGVTVPASATAVALNLTVTAPTRNGFLSAYPTGGTAQTLISNVNFTAGETVPNLAVVPVGSGGQVTFYNSVGVTQLVVDLEGYFSPESSGSTAGAYVPLSPSRIVDTRPNSGYIGAGAPLRTGDTLTFPVAGKGGVPGSGVSAVALNVTVTDTSANGFLTAYPAGKTRPLASNLNWTAGKTVPNRVVVPVGSGGDVTVYNVSGNTDVVVDVDGYFTDGSVALPGKATLYRSVQPYRVLDTRKGGGPIGGGATYVETLAGRKNSTGDYVVAVNATAAVLNVTVADTTANGFLTVYPANPRPLASDLNWKAGGVVANLTFASMSSSGSDSFYNLAGHTQLILDVFGYFLPFS